MSYCENCGRQILDESLGCPVCSVRNNIDYSRSNQERQEEVKAEPVTEFTVEDRNGASQRFESSRESGGKSYEPQSAKPVEERKLHPVVKVLVIVCIFLVGFVGYIAGLVAGIVLRKSPFEEYRKFGKTLMILCIVLLVLSVIGWILLLVVNSTMFLFNDAIFGY